MKHRTREAMIFVAKLRQLGRRIDTHGLEERRVVTGRRNGSNRQGLRKAKGD